MPLALPGTFIDGANIPVSAADMNQLRAAIQLVEGSSAGRRMPVTSSGAPQRDAPAAIWHPRGDYRQSWWGIRLRTGMTTLTIEGVCAHQLDFYVNGVLNSSQAAAPGGFTKNITLGAFTDGDVWLLNIHTNGNPATAPGGYSTKYLIYDVYTSPIVVPSTWPGVPSFSGTYNAARFNQLLDAAQYIWDRVTAVPIPPMIACIYTQATHRMETLQLFDGAVGRYATGEVLRVFGIVNIRTNAEHYEISYGGTTFTSPTYTAGQNVLIDHSFTLTQTLGTRVEVFMRAVVEDDTYLSQAGVFSTYTITLMRSETGAGGYATTAPPTKWTAGESVSAATLNTRLNTLATMLSNAKAKLDARPELWNRARAARRPYAQDETQHTRNHKRHCMMFQRQGNMLVVRGKGIKIGWGAVTVKPPAVKGEQVDPIDWLDFSFANEVSIGTNEGDVVQTHTVMLDGLKGLDPTMVYYVFGPSVEFCAEYIS